MKDEREAFIDEAVGLPEEMAAGLLTAHRPTNGESLAAAARELGTFSRRRRQISIPILGLSIPASWISLSLSVGIHSLLLGLGLVYAYHHFRKPPELLVPAAGNGAADRGGGIVWHEGAPPGGGLPDADDASEPAPSSRQTMVRRAGELDRQETMPDMHVSAPVVSTESLLPVAPLVGDISRPGRLSEAPNGRRRPVTKALEPGTSSGADQSPASNQAAPVPHAPRGEGSGSSAGNGTGSGSSGRAGVPAGVEGGALQAVYPEDARRQAQQGTVKLSVEILADGRVGAVSVVSGPPYRTLVESAISAVRSARFRPMMIDNRPVRSVVVIPFVFSLR